MNKFSLELLIKIFAHLHLQQKLQCMLVCRSWAHALISDGHILETISIVGIEHPELLNDRIKKLVKIATGGEPQHGNKCKKLFIHSYIESEPNISDLAMAFPYVETVSLTLCRPKNFGIAKQDLSSSSLIDQETTQFYDAWRNHVKTIALRSYNLDNFQDIFKTGVFHQLTTLHLYMDDYTYDVPVLFKLLKNAPLLLELAVSCGNITQNALEELHRNTCSIKSLTIKDKKTHPSYPRERPMRFETFDNLSSPPAPQLKSLKIITNQPNNAEAKCFLAYIQKKYTCLSKFTLLDNGSKSNVIVEKNKNATTGSIWIENNINTRNSLNGAYLGYHIYEFIGMIKDPMDMKSIGFSQPYSDTRFEKILSKFQFYGLKSISLMNEFQNNYRITKLNAFEELNELSLCYKNYSHQPQEQSIMVDLNTVFGALPKNITALHLDNYRLYFGNRIMIQPQQQFNITRLKLTNLTLEEDALRYIRICLPKLQSLVLEQFYTSYSLDLQYNRCLSYIDLTPGNYFHVELFIAGKRTTSPKLLLTRKNTSYCYEFLDPNSSCVNRPDELPFDLHDHTIKYAIRPCQLDEESHYLHLKCGNVKTIYFNSCLVL